MPTSQSNPSSYPIGTHKDEIDTPALCLDLDRMEQNIRQMVAICEKHRIAWRPHSKCHKSPDIAKKLIDAGALGMTCAKLGEAEVFAGEGVGDLLIANLIVGKTKIKRLVELRRGADPIVCIDHIDQAQPMSRAFAGAGLSVRVLIETDIGMRRAGVLPLQPTLNLARELTQLPGLEFVGLMGYEGHLLTIADVAEKEAAIRESIGQLVASANLLRKDGIECPIVSCGGTGSYPIATQVEGITEIQAGGAIFMDAFYRHACKIVELQYAMTILATVVSRPAPDRAIIDAGKKTLNQEIHTPLVGDTTSGTETEIAEHAHFTVQSLSAEHGVLLLSEPSEDLKIGTRIELIPGYGDLTTVLHDQFYAFRKNQLEAIWTLAGRGRLQ